jgi:hypothetical protein
MKVSRPSAHLPPRRVCSTSLRPVRKEPPNFDRDDVQLASHSPTPANTNPELRFSKVRLIALKIPRQAKGEGRGGVKNQKKMSPVPDKLEYIQVWQDTYGNPINTPAIAFFSVTVIAYATFTVIACCWMGYYKDRTKVLATAADKVVAPSEGLPGTRPAPRGGTRVDEEAAAPPYSMELPMSVAQNGRPSREWIRDGQSRVT